jgi:predicted dehydrogenase
VPAVIGKRPVRIQANGRGYLSTFEDVVFATLDFGDGVLAQCYTSWYALEKARRMTVVGETGVLHLDDFTRPRLTLFRRFYAASDALDPRGRRRWQWHDEGAEGRPVEDREPLKAECEHFLEVIRTGAQPRTDGVSAVTACAIVQACNDSIANDGAWISVEETP